MYICSSKVFLLYTEMGCIGFTKCSEIQCKLKEHHSKQFQLTESCRDAKAALLSHDAWLKIGCKIRFSVPDFGRRGFSHL